MITESNSNMAVINFLCAFHFRERERERERKRKREKEGERK
jgi:hypothetical protein